MIYKVWIQIKQIDEDKDHCVNIGPPHEAGRFDTEKTARKFLKKELTAAQIAGSAADLLDACESLPGRACHLDQLLAAANQLNGSLLTSFGHVPTGLFYAGVIRPF